MVFICPFAKKNILSIINRVLYVFLVSNWHICSKIISNYYNRNLFFRKLFQSIRLYIKGIVGWLASKCAWQIMIWVFWLLCFQMMAQAGRWGHLIPPLRGFKGWEWFIILRYPQYIKETETSSMNLYLFIRGPIKLRLIW